MKTRTLTIHIPNDRGNLYELIRYPAGEIQVRLTEKGILACAEKQFYVIVANPIPDLIELAQLKSALDGFQPWFRRNLDLMYLPYARADRRFVRGDSFGIQVFGRLLNALAFDAIYTFDVHSSRAESHIANLINLDPIHCYNQIGEAINYLGEKGLCLISPDHGAVSRYDLKALGLPVVQGEKKRDPKTGKLSGFVIQDSIKKYKKGLIVDDICDGGGTFVGLAEEIHRVNPKIELSLYVSHGIFSQGYTKLDKEFKGRLFVSDFTYEFPDNQNWEKI